MTCPKCSHDTLVRIGTQNIKICPNCATHIPWDPKGRPPVYGGVDKERQE